MRVERARGREIHTLKELDDYLIFGRRSVLAFLDFQIPRPFPQRKKKKRGEKDANTSFRDERRFFRFLPTAKY